MKSIFTPLLVTVLLNTSFTTYTSPFTFFNQSTVTKADIKEYEGSYSFQSDSPVRKFIITIKESELYGEADQYGANKLIKQAEADTFLSTSSYGSTIIFTRDAATKKVTGLRLIIQGTTLEASRDQ